MKCPHCPDTTLVMSDRQGIEAVANRVMEALEQPIQVGSGSRPK